MTGRIVQVNLEEQMKSAYIDYSMSVIVSRALPDVRDGLKPVHRRILYDMSAELNLYSDKPTRKSARIVGDTMGKYHPHGDSSVYDAMVRLAQPFNTRYMMDMLTKFGYIDDAWKVITSDEYPSFGYMFQNEATTIWERFEMKKNPGMNSHNHPMYGAVGYWFYAYLGGIIPTEPGFSRVSIKPYFPEKLLSCHAVVDTVMGANNFFSEFFMIVIII